MEGFRHEPVLLAEVLEGLGVRPGGLWIDCTIGGGGHAEAVLRASAPTGRLIGCDLDPEAVAAARERLRGFGDRVTVHEGSYVDLEHWAPRGECDGVVGDFGVSSWQLDNAERGFSHQKHGKLDMRFGPGDGPTAMDLVNQTSVTELEKMIRELGDEPRARRLARAVEAERRRSPITTTTQLAALAERVCPRRGARIHPATRLFQALRLATNRELENLAVGLQVMWRLLRPAGRLALIGFHSGENRLIKQFSRELARNYTVTGEVDRPEFRTPCEPRLRRVYRRPLRPSPTEVGRNPRSRSAFLHLFEKLRD